MQVAVHPTDQGQLGAALPDRLCAKCQREQATGVATGQVCDGSDLCTKRLAQGLDQDCGETLCLAGARLSRVEEQEPDRREPRYCLDGAERLTRGGQGEVRAAGRRSEADRCPGPGRRAWDCRSDR